MADLRRDFVTMVNCCLSDVDLSELDAILAGHLADGEAFVKRENIPLVRVHIVREADISYEGQTHVIRTSLPSGPLSQDTIADSFRSARPARAPVGVPP